VSAIDVMPIKPSNLNFFMFQGRYSSASRPLHMREIFLSPAREVLHKSFEVAQVAVHPARDRAIKAGAYL
jgi:hypothetical protein